MSQNLFGLSYRNLVTLHEAHQVLGKIIVDRNRFILGLDNVYR